jgi:ABC-type multidrug transport system ATPase subunit
MKQRLGIAVSLVHDPDLVILDEPMNGLDPQGMADIRKLITHLSKDLGKTIFISSHMLSEMEQVADSLLIIHKGKKVVEGKMASLLNPDSINLLEALKLKGWHLKEAILQNRKLILNMNPKQIPALIKQLGEMPFEIYSVRSKHSLENYFLSLTTG